MQGGAWRRGTKNAQISIAWMDSPYSGSREAIILLQGESMDRASCNGCQGFGPFEGNGDFKLDALDIGSVATRWRLANGQKGGGLA